jgi:hypothetical protein
MTLQAPVGVRRKVTDRWGFELTATEAGQRAWEAAVSALMDMSAEAPQLLDKVAVVDPDLAIGRALRAFVNHLRRSSTCDIDADLTVAERTQADIGPRERSAVWSLTQFVRGGSHAAFGHLRDHLVEFPSDPVVGHSFHLALLAGEQPQLKKLAYQMVVFQARTSPDDCGWLGLAAFGEAEFQRYDQAVVLAERALHASARDANAAHALMHCHYETGEHEAGLRWLVDWLAGGAPLGHFEVHFPWHAAMHELALGDLEAARRRCGTQVPAEATADIASLLWRFRLAKAPFDSTLLRAAVSGAQPGGQSVPTAFDSMNLTLCLAAADDSAGLHDFALRISNDPRPEMADLLVPLAQGFAALIEQRPREAVRLLTSVATRVTALGGSRLQREIVEDTLLLALIDAGQRDDALNLLGKRLNRRPPTHFERELFPTEVSSE